MNKWAIWTVAAVLVWSTFLIAEITVDNCYGRKENTAETSSSHRSTEGKMKKINVLVGEEVVSMDINEYLTGVLLCEIPADFCVEAKKAQAVVARTYAMRTAKIGIKHGEGVVCADPDCCQGYISAEDYVSKWNETKPVESAMAAVIKTDAEVLIWNEQLIDATYFSCSGGKTESAVAVWGADVPDLQSVESPGEEEADHYLYTVRISANELKNKLGINGNGNPINWVEAISYTEGGGVDMIVICGKQFSGTQLRSLIGLRSTNFTITAMPDGFIITTKGFGHRVGMSQYGANAMAMKGYSYDQILHHYYKDVTIQSLE